MYNLKKTGVLLLTLCLLSFQSLMAQSSERISVNHFTKLGVSGHFETVTLEKGEEGVVLRGSAADIANVEIENKGNSLGIGVKKGKKIKGKVTVVVYFQELERIANSGSSDFKANSTITGDQLHIAFSGSGDFDGAIDVNELHLAISGSADFELDGRADKQDIAISGSGDVKAGNLKGKEAKIAISGSGDVDLNVSGRVKSAVSGSGNVQNRG